MHKSILMLLGMHNNNSCMLQGLVRKSIMILLGKLNHDSLMHRGLVHKYYMIVQWRDTPRLGAYIFRDFDLESNL